MRSFLSIPETNVEPLASVLNTLRLERLGDKNYRGSNLRQLNDRVYGGQVLAQATMAAADTLPEGEDRLVNSITAAFLRPGLIAKPTDFAIVELNDGRSFSTRTVNAVQDGKIIFTARVSAQLHQPGPAFGATQPEAPDPQTLPSSVDFFASLNNPQGHIMSTTNSLDMRHVEGHLYLRPAKERTPRQLIWIRSRSAMPDGSSKLLQRAMLGYAADQFMLEPVMRATGLHWGNPEASFATLDHSIWWHRNFDMSDWILAELESPSAQNGRGLVIAKFFQNGRHIATMSQEGMVKVRSIDKKED
ncbi:MAG: thioesterase family protein [Actinomycetaceae bacterium]|nr:thioesterase family protein [Actinomycetaceae bacterium]